MVHWVLLLRSNCAPMSFCLGKFYFYLVDAGYVVKPRFLPS